MKQIILETLEDVLALHRQFYVEPTQKIVRILATGTDDDGHPARVRMRKLTKLFDFAEDEKVKELFAAFLPDAKGREVCLGDAWYLAESATRINEKLAALKSSDAALGDVCERAIERIFGYGHFCAGEHYVLCPSSKCRQKIVYSLSLQPNDIAFRIGKCDKWCAWTYCHRLQNDDRTAVRYCPYCNRSPLTLLSFQNGFDREELRRSALDHFFPVSLYPFLGVSLHNLVPCCDFCNSNLKRGADMVERFLHHSIVHPYVCDFDSGRYFCWGDLKRKALTCSLKKEDVKVDTCPGREYVGESAGSYDFFHVKACYEQNCADEIALLPRRLQKVYSRELEDVQRILRIKPCLRHTYEKDKELIFGQSFARHKINSSPLGKLTIDLVNDLERV